MTGAFGLVLIGDELLSGKRSDKHFAWVVSTLNQRGLKLGWCRILGDDDIQITAVLRECFAGEDIVFSCGGIGATPDDRTRACAAAALGVPLEPHPEGTRLIEARYGETARPQRVRMAEFPRGARLIPNPVNNVSGFSVGRVHFVPGFPNMARPMIQWVLDTEYGQLQATPEIELLLRVRGSGEGDLIPVMEAILAAYPAVKLSSLPETGNRLEIELSIRGVAPQALPAYAELRKTLEQRGLQVTGEREIKYG